MCIAGPSARSADDVVVPPALEKRGAGGSGLFGLPPYFEDGVPGLGDPFRSAGSYGMFDGGGRGDRDERDESREGDHDERVGEPLGGE